MNRCDTCNNLLETRRVETSYCRILNRPLYEKQTYCPYCEWKGDAGTGKQLKELIKGERGCQ